jgi:photosynthetic reaction center cytochrome c subunit
VNPILKGAGALATVLFSAGVVYAYKSTVVVQRGNPGLAMELVNTKDQVAAREKANKIPYKNVQVIGHISSGEFTRLMTAITTWVAPEAGCGYCHAPQRDAAGNVVKNDEGFPQADLAKMDSDELYTKRVARRMIQMTMHVNGEWKDHVKATGVTCYTCHRGNPVPANIWFDEPTDTSGDGMLGYKANQNAPAKSVGLTSLPTNVLRPFLAGDENIRIQSTEAIASPNRASIKQAEWTYGLMMHFSSALGVNCTHCHNTRSMGEWSTSPVTRAQAWYGIRMVRDLNKAYLEPLLANFPANRLGPTGDSPKVNCATCHQGAYKPLLGVSMLKDYMVLAEARPQPEKTPEPVVETPPVLANDGGAASATPAAASAGSGPTPPPAAVKASAPTTGSASVPPSPPRPAASVHP